MMYELTPKLDDATYIHQNIAREYRLSNSVEHILKLRHVSHGIGVNTPVAKAYAKVRQESVSDEVVLVVNGPDGIIESFWLFADRLPSVARTLIHNDYVVTYADGDFITVDNGSVEVPEEVQDE